MNILTILRLSINVSVIIATKLVVIENATLVENLPRLTPYPLAGADFLSSKNYQLVRIQPYTAEI
jgi:hypothetical protein